MRVKPGFEGGISTVVGEVLLIAIAGMAMSAVALVVISGVPPPVRHPTLEVRLENADKAPDFDNIAVVIYHMGGDTLGIPNGPDDEFRVQGGYIGTGLNPNTWDNIVSWDSWVFENSAKGFQTGEFAVGLLKYNNANANIGDKLWIAITDLPSGTLIFRDSNITLENSLTVYG